MSGGDPREVQDNVMGEPTAAILTDDFGGESITGEPKGIEFYV